MTPQQLTTARRLDGPARARYLAVVGIDNLEAAHRANAGELEQRRALVDETVEAILRAADGERCPICSTPNVPRRLCADCQEPLACEACHVNGRSGGFSCLGCNQALCWSCHAVRDIQDPNWQGLHYLHHEAVARTQARERALDEARSFGWVCLAIGVVAIAVSRLF